MTAAGAAAGATNSWQRNTQLSKSGGKKKQQKEQIDSKGIRRSILKLQLLLRNTELTGENRKDITSKLALLKARLQGTPTFLDEDEIFRRRSILAENEGLMDVMSIFWYVLSPYLDDEGILTKAGYIAYFVRVQRALIDTVEPIQEVKFAARFSYMADQTTFGDLNKLAFFDLFYDLIDTWTEVVTPDYYATFAWSLLDSVADLHASPPHLRPISEVTCCTNLMNEGGMVQQFMFDTNLRALVAVSAKSLERLPEAIKRVMSRKKAQVMSDTDAGRIQLMYEQMVKEGKVNQDLTPAALARQARDSRLVPVLDPDGKPVLGPDGKPVMAPVGLASVGSTDSDSMTLTSELARDEALQEAEMERREMLAWKERNTYSLASTTKSTNEYDEDDDDEDSSTNRRRNKGQFKPVLDGGQTTDFREFSVANRTTLLQSLRQRTKVEYVSRAEMAKRREDLANKYFLRMQALRESQMDPLDSLRWNLGLTAEQREKYLTTKFEDKSGGKEDVARLLVRGMNRILTTAAEKFGKGYQDSAGLAQGIQRLEKMIQDNPYISFPDLDEAVQAEVIFCKTQDRRREDALRTGQFCTALSSKLQAMYAAKGRRRRRSPTGQRGKQATAKKRNQDSDDDEDDEENEDDFPFDEAGLGRSPEPEDEIGGFYQRFDSMGNVIAPRRRRGLLFGARLTASSHSASLEDMALVGNLEPPAPSTAPDEAQAGGAAPTKARFSVGDFLMINPLDVGTESQSLALRLNKKGLMQALFSTGGFSAGMSTVKRGAARKVLAASAAAAAPVLASASVAATEEQSDEDGEGEICAAGEGPEVAGRQERRAERRRRRHLREHRRALRQAAQERVEVLKNESLSVRHKLLLEHLSGRPQGDEGSSNRAGCTARLPLMLSPGRGRSSPTTAAAASAVPASSSAQAEISRSQSLPALVSPIKASARPQQQHQHQHQQSVTWAVDQQEQEQRQEQGGAELLPGALLEEDEERDSPW